jgi:hypothetical protein
MNNRVDAGNTDRGTCLDCYIESFENSLKARNYAASTIKVHRVLVGRLAAMMETVGIVPSCLTIELAAEA